jgi:putative protein kinase ArgK-like GTPase of G3E family
MIKRGIMEVADVVAVNKADGETEKAAMRAASEYSGCLHLMPHRCVVFDTKHHEYVVLGFKCWQSTSLLHQVSVH